MFNALKRVAAGATNRLGGRTDYLEAVVAGAVLVAAAEGGVDDDEIGSMLEVLSGIPQITENFKESDIERAINTMVTRSKTLVGKNGLYKEVEDIAKDPEMSETVLLTVMEVANSDGSVGDAEKKVINRIAQKLRLDPAKYEL